MDDDFEGAYSDSTIEENDDAYEVAHGGTGREFDVSDQQNIRVENAVVAEVHENHQGNVQIVDESAELAIHEVQAQNVQNDSADEPAEHEVYQIQAQNVQNENESNLVELEVNQNGIPNLEIQNQPLEYHLPLNENAAESINNQREFEVNDPVGQHNERNVENSDDSNGVVLFDKSADSVEPTTKCAKRSRVSDSEDEENDTRNVCPICMDNWTNAGAHRLVCLRCGHLFGQSCIIRWLDVACSSGQRRCPQCNKKASKRDIRMLYVHNLQVLDTSENEKLKEEIEMIKQQKARLEMELATVNLSNKLQQEELKDALNKIKTLEKLRDQSSHYSQTVSQPHVITRLSMEHSIEISSSGGCRVMTSNTSLRELYVSHSSTNALFPGFSVRKVDMHDHRPSFGQCVYLHTKAIRDLAVRPQSNDLLLSVSLDKTAKLLDLSSNSVINKFVTNSALWSCCWDCTNLNRFFVGSQNGTVTQYDSRQPSSPLQQLTVPGDLSPVTSLASLAYCAGRALPQGGLLVSKLVSCWAYTQNVSGDQYEGQQLPLEGPFTSLCYDKDTNHILVSRRPSVRNPNICHMVCQLEQHTDISCNIIHRFEGGTAQMQLSRPCFAKGSGDTLVSAYVESRNNICVWSLSSGQAVASVKVYDPVKDICPLWLGDKLWFAGLSEKTLRFYCMS